MAPQPKNPELDRIFYEERFVRQFTPAEIARRHKVRPAKVRDSIYRHQLRLIRAKVANHLIEKKEIYIPANERKSA